MMKTYIADKATLDSVKATTEDTNILLIVFLCLTVFTIAMIALFTVYGSVPDTLITCVFATLGGECGILGWIKTTKEKKQDRRWQLADMRREKEEAERIAQQTEEP